MLVELLIDKLSTKAASLPERTIKSKAVRLDNKSYTRKAACTQAPISSFTATVPAATSRTKRNLRDQYNRIARQDFPSLKPRDDIDLLYLATHGVPPHEEFYSYVDRLVAANVDMFGGGAAGKVKMLETTAATLDSPLLMLRIKPFPGDDKDVYVRPIPNSKFSLRLFGKHMEHERSYGPDFIDTATGQVVNRPFAHELWMTLERDSTTPALHSRTPEQAFTAEHWDGIEHPRAGKEKYILREGVRCLLMREGHKPVYFKVPVRTHLDAERNFDDIDTISFV